MFGRFLRHDRLKTGRSIEECARLAGMAAAEWELMEAGQVLPATREKLQAMAVALDMEWANMLVLAFFCRDAWD
jgi:transcriptional regulator with XRE-family HTH domain